LLLLAAAAAGDDACQAGSDCAGEYYWPGRARGPFAASSTPHSAPTDFSSGPTWVWKNELGEQTRHSPLIDNEKSIYITTARRIRKFSPDGALLWQYTMDTGERSSTSPALYKGHLYLMSRDDAMRTVFFRAFDLQTGEVAWKKVLEETYSHADATSISVFNGTILLPTRDHLETRPYEGGDDGNNQVTALSASDGAMLWQYTIDDLVWNFVPSTSGDGDVLFASQCGGAWRLTHDGKLLWRGGRASPRRFCGCGGGLAGPNGIFYSEFNDWRDPRGPGVVQAIRISDGSLLWERYFGRFEGWQYPAVGRVGPDLQLAVIAPLGGITSPPSYPLPSQWPFHPWWFKFILWHGYLRFWWVRRLLQIRSLPNAIVALDPLTGSERWRYVEEEWNHIGSITDETMFPQRIKSQIDGEVMCLPDPQGIPLIAGDGTVYGSSSHNGDLTAIKDANGNGVIEPGEVSRFETGHEFLNSPSLAPGMLVAAPCWGPVYVFKDGR